MTTQWKILSPSINLQVIPFIQYNFPHCFHPSETKNNHVDHKSIRVQTESKYTKSNSKPAVSG